MSEEESFRPGTYLDRFARFGSAVAVLHSGLSGAERYDEWRRVRGWTPGERPRIVVGARSAIFAPMSQLGVLIVDEEHDASFKQDETPRYHARDLALVRGRDAGAVVILGSATPSAESIHNARQGKMVTLALPGRVHARPMPEIEIVRLQGARMAGGGRALISERLAEALAETVGAGEQAILFLNRRGYSSTVLCRTCGFAYGCGRCSVALTHHRAAGRLICHYCGFARTVPQRCDACQSGDVGLLGLGTERIEDAVAGLIPDVRVGRLDRDALSRRGRLRELLGAFARHEMDVLVGTQMVAKGHDFPGVTLVGVILADQSLHFPDFRAGERTFQLLTQVAGRAGRGDRPGRVIIQTYQSDHHAIRAAASGDAVGFYERDLRVRQALHYPPFARLACVRIEGEHLGRTQGAADTLGRRAERILASRGDLSREVTILGPAQAPIFRLRNRYRFQLLCKAARVAAQRAFLGALLEPTPGQRRPAGVRITADIDPVDLL